MTASAFKFLLPLPTAQAKAHLRMGAALGDAVYGFGEKKSSMPHNESIRPLGRDSLDRHDLETLAGTG